MSSTSTSSANSSLSGPMPNSTEMDSIYHEILIVFPNGYKISKKIDSRKAIYDLLIELSAAAKLIPTNYKLKLYNQEETATEEDPLKIIEYTPNQTIGQLKPTKIKILPKASTLKHIQNQSIDSQNNQIKYTSSQLQHNFTDKDAHIHSTSNLNMNKNQVIQQPFEVTTRVEVNLPFNQKTAVRVKPEITIQDLIELICKEASLDKKKYELLISTKNGANVCMNAPFYLYETKEVTLAFKTHFTNENSKVLNSKSSHSIFAQNVLKSRTQPKNYFQKKQQSISNNQFGNDGSMCRSKSELDLANQSEANNSESYDKQSQTKKKPFSSNNSMFGFFTRKKNNGITKSRNSLIEQEIQKKSVTDLELRNCLDVGSNLNEKNLYNTKHKKLAPAPPIQNNKINSNDLKLRPDPQVNKHNLNNLDLDKDSIEKLILTKKKKKAPAPPPPATIEHANGNEKNIESTENSNNLMEKKKEIATLELSNQTILSENLTQNTSEIDQNNCIEKNLTVSILTNSSPPSSFRSSLTSSPLLLKTVNQNNYETEQTSLAYTNESNNANISINSESKISVDDSESLLKRKLSINSIPYSAIESEEYEATLNESKNIVKNPQYIPANNISISSSQESNGNEAQNCSITTIDDISKAFATAITIGEKYLLKCEIESNKAHINNETHQYCNYEEIAVNKINIPIFDEKNFQESNLNENSVKNSNKNRPTTILIGSNSSFVLDSCSTQVNDNHKYMNDSNHHPDYPENNIMMNDETNESTTNNKKAFNPVKKTAIIEVRPEYASSTLITISKQNEQIDLVTNSNSSICSENIIYNHRFNNNDLQHQKTLSLPTSSSSFNHLMGNYLNGSKNSLEEINFNETNQGVTNNFSVHDEFNYKQKSEKNSCPILRSPMSPLPHFPAIGENDLNELHPNYTVIRSGDIIEKNGTYYSTDGTIRGYSGTVKKLASSKTLNEVFLKQKELEEEHERIEKEKIKEKDKNEKVVQDSFNKNPNQINHDFQNNSETISRKSLNKTNDEHSPLKNHTEEIALRSSSNINSNKNKPRLSLGNIIANEKKTNQNTSTLSSNSNIFSQAPFKKINFKSEQKFIEKKDEKKVEDHESLSNNSPNSNSIKSEGSSGSILIDSSVTNTMISPQSSQIKFININSSSSSSTSSLSSSSFDNATLNSNKKNAGSKNSKPFLTSFVMSAKKSSPNAISNNSNVYSKVTPSIEIIHQHRNSLLNELKSLVPLAEGEKSNSKETKQSNNQSPPPAPPIPIHLNKSITNQFAKQIDQISPKLPPAVAPKNFLTNTNKNCMINNRENLMNSIKSFSINNLRKVNHDN